MLDRFSKNPFINFKIILDCDDVLFGCNEQAIQKLNKEKGTSYKMSDITSWGTHNTGIDERLKYFADPKFVKNQPVYPGAQEFVHKLSKKAEVVIATNVPAQCASVRINVIVKNFPEIKISNILIGARKDLLNADMMLDDAPQISTSAGSTLTNLEGAEARNLDAITLCQCIADGFENNVKSSVSLSLGHTGGLDDGSNDVVLTNSVSHDFSPFFFYGIFV